MDSSRDDELARLSILLLTWMLERQGEAASNEHTQAAADDETFAAARVLSARLLNAADGKQTEPRTTERIRGTFATLIATGCWEEGDDDRAAYSLEVIDNKSSCIVRGGYGDHCYDRAFIPGPGDPNSPFHQE